MIWLRSLVFNVAFYGWTAVMCAVMLWTFFMPYRFILYVTCMWLRHVAWIERNIGGITCEVLGRQHVPAGACIIAAKHQSAWETFKLFLLFDDPAIVLKQELLSVPVWGWYLRRSGAIAIDRKAGMKALPGMMQSAHDAVVRGRKIVIFPQGTRLAPGVDRPYKSGVAALYMELNLPVVPMALNSGLFWPRNSFIKKSGKITIEFLPAIPAGLPREEMMRRLRADLEAASNRLLVRAV